MAKQGRQSVEETIIEEALSAHELEKLLIGFLEALEKEQRLGILPEKEDKDSLGESA